MRVHAATFNGMGRLRAVPGYVSGAPAGCPMLTDGSCAWGGDASNAVSCNLIRECDAATGAVHFEYTLPSGPVPNANIWSVAGDGSMVWLGPDGTPGTPPAGVGIPNPNGPIQSVGNQNWFKTWEQQQGILTGNATQTPVSALANSGASPVGVVTSQLPPTPAPVYGNNSNAPASTPPPNTSSSTIISGVSNTVLYVGLGLVALFFMKGKN